MENASLYLIMAATGLIAVAMLAMAGLKGFTAWLELKRAELEAHKPSPSSNTGNRIDIADLKERIRKLEAIAAGVDL